MSIDRELKSKYIPAEKQSALQVRNLDETTLLKVVDYLRGRAGLEPYRRGENLVFLPSREVREDEVYFINQFLEVMCQESARLAWGAIANVKEFGDIPIPSQELLDLGRTGAYRQHTEPSTPIVPIIEPEFAEMVEGRDTVDDGSPRFNMLRAGEFLRLPHGDLAINVAGYCDEAVDNLMASLLALDASRFGDVRDEELIFAGARRIGDFLYVDDGGSELTLPDFQNVIARVVTLELKMYQRVTTPVPKG